LRDGEEEREPCFRGGLRSAEAERGVSFESLDDRGRGEDGREVGAINKKKKEREESG
jgi:hypothetical protein